MTYINSDVLPEPNWASRLGASSLRVNFPGTGVLGVSSGIGASAALPVYAGAHALPRVRDKVAFVAPPQQQDAVATLLGQTNSHNYMTGASAVGEGASGPPPYREPV